MPAQDDSREARLIDRFNLERPANASRSGTDAVLDFHGELIEFELKSITIKGDLGTARDIGPSHIEKWRRKHWIVGFFDQGELTDCRYASPATMAPWIDEIWQYIKPDFELALLVPPLVTVETMKRVLGDKPYYTKAEVKAFMKNEFSAAAYKMDVRDGKLLVGYSQDVMFDLFKKRVQYVLKRGATYNNKKIRLDFIHTWPSIKKDHAARLRELIQSWADLRSA